MLDEKAEIAIATKEFEMVRVFIKGTVHERLQVWKGVCFTDFRRGIPQHRPEQRFSHREVSLIREAYDAGRHAVRRQENGTYAARNPGQRVELGMRQTGRLEFNSPRPGIQRVFASRLTTPGPPIPSLSPPIALQAYLKASNTATNDAFGSSVALSDDTAIVGAILEDSAATGLNAGAETARRSFVIRSAGTLDLADITVSVDDDNAGAFFVTTSPAMA